MGATMMGVKRFDGECSVLQVESGPTDELIVHEFAAHEAIYSRNPI
jgi:hypothetical protein